MEQTGPGSNRKASGRTPKREGVWVCKNAMRNMQKQNTLSTVWVTFRRQNLLTCVKTGKYYRKSGRLAASAIISDCQKTPGRCRRGRSPSDFHSYPTALPAGRVVDFACKINSLHLRTTSGWPKVPSRKSGENHFFDTLNISLFFDSPACGSFLQWNGSQASVYNL